MVEGRYDEWMTTNPASLEQMQCLDEAGQGTWLGTEVTEAKGKAGNDFTLREASGFDVLWATKIGGPSHAFDTMTQCILSILGNARTKAITVSDSRWHQPAVRAYLRMMPDPDGNPMVYLEPLQLDFPYRRSVDHDQREIARLVFGHALAKAKEMGVGLFVTGAYQGAAMDKGLGFAKPPPIVLEPSAMGVESSDTLKVHDWPQPNREVIHGARAYFIPADQVANA